MYVWLWCGRGLQYLVATYLTKGLSDFIIILPFHMPRPDIVAEVKNMCLTIVPIHPT